MSDKEKEDPEISNPDDGYLDFFKTTEVAFKLPENLEVDIVSGCGKSNFMEWVAIESLKLGIPITVIDPHGDCAQRILRSTKSLPILLKKVRYINLGNPSEIAPFNPLRKPLFSRHHNQNEQ